jgi:segregation and condensation protein A
MAANTALTVKTSVYEGPLDLLLELIEKRKLLINDISLAQVTDEYIAKVNSLDALPLGDTADFVALAATLLLIKSRSLLPMLTLSDDEEHDVKELAYRLAVYQLIKDSGRALRKGFAAPMLYDGSGPEPQPLFVPDGTVTLAGVRAAAQMLLEGFPQTPALPKIAVKKIVSLEEMIQQLSSRVTAAMRLSFKEFTSQGKKERADIVVSFLALLELIKQGIIKATQDKDFGDITLESDSVSIPSYE